MTISWDLPPIWNLGDLHHSVCLACEEILNLAQLHGFIDYPAKIKMDWYHGWTSFELVETVPNPVRFLFWTIPFRKEARLARWVYYHPRAPQIIGCLNISLEIYYPALIPICARVAQKLINAAPIDLTVSFKSISRT